MTCSCDIKKPTDKPSKCTVTVCYDSLARDKGSAWEEEDCRLSQALPGPITLQALSNAKNPLRRKQQNSFLHIGLSFPPSLFLSLILAIPLSPPGQAQRSTHVRLPVLSDWLLPACCSLVRSMCSTYVWIIWQTHQATNTGLRSAQERQYLEQECWDAD